ncbi:MAG: hypothetical protein RLZ33_442 [Bacteroidota bacterium]|jgi:hypothetical protein
MKTITIFIICLVSFSCSVLKNTKKIEFQGQVCVKSYKGSKIQVEFPIKSSLTLYKNDSTEIASFETNENGEFKETIVIKKKWNPLFLKIQGLENKYLDTLIPKYDIGAISFSCNSHKETIYNIFLKRDYMNTFYLNCVMNENVLNDYHE